MTTPAARALVFAGCAWLLASTAPVPTGAAAGRQVAGAPQANRISTSPARATLDRYCVTCHNDRLRTGGLTLAALDPSNVSGHAELWERVVRKLRTREMPPPGCGASRRGSLRRHCRDARARARRHAAAHPQPGRVAVHRLSRTEYANAVRDLLAIELPAPALLPADEPDQQTFDNVASVLSVSPALLENYLSAAYRVSRLAVADPSAAPAIDAYTVPLALVAGRPRGDDLPFGSQGGLAFRHHFPATGDYTITVTLRRQLYRYIVGLGEPHQIDMRLDGVRVRRFTIGGEGRGLTAPESFAGNTQGDPDWEVYMHTADEGLQVRVPVSAGVHDVSVSFVRRHWEPEGHPAAAAARVRQDHQRALSRPSGRGHRGRRRAHRRRGRRPPRPPAARGCSCASPRRPPGRRPVRGAFSKRWPRVPIAVRSRRPSSRR